MKKIIFISLLVASFASAHTIEGTLILKGTIKTKISVNSVKTTCRVKVDKVRNLMREDSYGNPAYNVKVTLGLDGSDLDRNLTVRFEKELWMNNLFAVGTKTEVRDFEYAASEGERMTIDATGRIKSVTFSFNRQPITCFF